MAVRRESGRRLLRLEADALQVALEPVADDGRGAAAALFVDEFGARRLRALDLDRVVRDEPARIEAHELVAQPRRQRQPADEFGEDAEVDAVARYAQQLPFVDVRHAVARGERVQRQRAGERRAVRERRLAELGVQPRQVQRVVALRVDRDVPAEARDRNVEPRLRRAHAQRDVVAAQLAARAVQMAVAEMRPDRVVDPARVRGDAYVRVARERRQVDGPRRQIRVARPVRRFTDRRERLVDEARAEIERAVEQRAVRGRLQRDPVDDSVVEHRDADACQRELGRVVLRVAPAQRAAAQHDRLLLEQPRAERVVGARLRGRHRDARDEQRAVRAALGQQVRIVDDEARQRRREARERAPRQRGRRMRHR
ncbi:hypothetical protein Y049_1359 [Burkholderia pseudomallei MSHR684]|nr:hypothetical protein Y049_1359 [Burkholderia pseudomallei MSHR684]